jgi:hypothetical protein
VLEQVRWLLRDAATFQVRRCTCNDDTARTGKPDVGHIAIDGLHEPDTRVEALGNDVHEAVIDANVDLHLRVLLDEAGQQASKYQRRGARRNGQPGLSRDLAGPGGDRL